MMTSDAIQKIEEKIHKDGSLTEEKKTELLNLLATMNPELANSPRSQEKDARKNTGLSKQRVFLRLQQKKSQKHIWRKSLLDDDTQ